MPHPSDLGFPTLAPDVLIGAGHQSGSTLEPKTVTGTGGIAITFGAGTLNVDGSAISGGGITLTTTGTSGAATYSGGTLNIPQYAGTTYTATAPVIVTGSVISLATTGLNLAQSYSTPSTTSIGSGTLTLNLSNNNNFEVTLTGSITIAFTGGNNGQRFQIEFIQGGSGSYAVTWPTVKWANKTQPTLTTAVGGIDLLAFYVNSAGAIHGGVAFPNIG